MFALALVLAFQVARVDAQENEQQLQLDVVINKCPTEIIGAFTLLDDHRMAVRREELEGIGISPPGDAPPDKLIVLDDLTGLSYRYEEATQRIAITVPEAWRIRKEYRISKIGERIPTAPADYGAVLNYSLFSVASRPTAGAFAFNGSSATFDGRFFTPFGNFSQSAILRTSNYDAFEALRLDSAFTYSEPETLTKYQAGDTISSGLAWTRPIRMGGFQVQRNFGLRPDLVTLPLPSAQGSAAVPSTVDVYINGIKTFSQDVGSGPYQINNIPAVSGSGMAQVVLHDASGRETVTTIPFYTAASLLAPGLLDFSVEAGLPRVSYGTPTDTYVSNPAGSASFRYGMFDWLTVAGHAEGGAGVWNSSAGVAALTGTFGVASAAFAASYYQGNAGFQSYVAYQTKIWGIDLSASSQMTFGPYNDLASATAQLQPNIANDPFGFGSYFRISSSTINTLAASLFTSAQPPRALNRFSMGIPLPFDKASLSANFIQSRDGAGNASSIATVSLSFALPHEISAFATAFMTVEGQKNNGLFAGLSMPIGAGVTASTSVSSGATGTSVNAEITKPLDLQPGSVGWQVLDSEGGVVNRSAAGSYRSSFARFDAGVSQNETGVTGSAQVTGAIATLGGGVFFANRIDDAFAVVETGVPDVEVSHNNRPVGVTDSAGRALVPDLASYQPNKIAIDTAKLPVDAEILTTESIVAPADRSGVRVNFAVKTNVQPALVVFQGQNGEPLPAGSTGQVEGGENFVVGYDGQAYIKNLSAENNVTVTTADRECKATFHYEPRPNEQVVISPVMCR